MMSERYLICRTDTLTGVTKFLNKTLSKRKPVFCCLPSANSLYKTYSSAESRLERLLSTDREDNCCYFLFKVLLYN